MYFKRWRVHVHFCANVCFIWYSCLKQNFPETKKLKKTKKQKTTWDGLTMQKNYKKQQNKTNKHNIAGYVFLIFLQWLLPQFLKPS